MNENVNCVFSVLIGIKPISPPKLLICCVNQSLRLQVQNVFVPAAVSLPSNTKFGSVGLMVLAKFAFAGPSSYSNARFTQSYQYAPIPDVFHTVCWALANTVKSV